LNTRKTSSSPADSAGSPSPTRRRNVSAILVHTSLLSFQERLGEVLIDDNLKVVATECGIPWGIRVRRMEFLLS